MNIFVFLVQKVKMIASDESRSDTSSIDSVKGHSAQSASTLSVPSDHDMDSPTEDFGTCDIKNDVSRSVPKDDSDSISPKSYPLKSCQMICQAVFGEQPVREDIVRKKFAVKQDQITALTMSQLLEVMAKKLINQKYCFVKDGTNMSNMRMESITVHKEIALQAQKVLYVCSLQF